MVKVKRLIVRPDQRQVKENMRSLSAKAVLTQPTVAMNI
jgi:hypothetical protein